MDERCEREFVRSRGRRSALDTTFLLTLAQFVKCSIPMEPEPRMQVALKTLLSTNGKDLIKACSSGGE